MAELIIQVPDELAQRLEPLRSQLPDLLVQLLDSTRESSEPSLASNSPETPQAYLEVLDFLMTRPTLQDVVAFKVSSTAQERLRSLLAKNREGIITDSEMAELESYEQLEHLMILMKARAIAAVGQ
jgi:hypothetical protein